jgi:hypothetical protein
MSKKLTTCGRSHLKQIMQIFKRALKVIKKPNRCIEKLKENQAKS